MRRTHSLLAVPLLLLPTAVLPGCQMNERTTGTIAGVAGGALLGAAISGSAGAILLGAAGGGLVGYVIGDYLTDCRCGTGGNGGGCGSCGVPSPCQVPASACAVPCHPAANPNVPTSTAAPSPSAQAARAAYERGRGAATVEQARAAYEESVRLDPSRPEPWNALAVLSLAQGDPTQARAQLDRALALDPGYAPARHNRERLERGS